MDMRTLISRAVASLLLSMASATALAAPPVVSVLQADLMSPSSTAPGADAWYGTFGSTNTPKLCTLIPSSDICTTGRPAEIRELARTLGAGRYLPDAYAARVFEYVYANIDTEFRYGLSKGALGAVLDQSGTAFDQAHLMVELLREGNVAATYEAGTIALNATQFGNWTGVTNAVAACRLLADGGIPAIINGSTSATCNYGTASVSTVTLSHVWVVAAAKRYDPAYKKYSFKLPVDYATVTGCGTGCATTVANAAIPTGPTFDSAANASYVQNIQTTALANQLKTYGTNLENYIKSDLTRAGWAVEDVVGGAGPISMPSPHPAQHSPTPRCSGRGTTSRTSTGHVCASSSTTSTNGCTRMS